MELVAGAWRGCSEGEVTIAMEEVWSSVRKVIEGVRHPRIVSLRVNCGIRLRQVGATEIGWTCHSMPGSRELSGCCVWKCSIARGCFDEYPRSR